MEAAKEGVGGCAPQQPKTLNQLNNRSSLWRKCENTLSDRKYSPKSEPVKMTGSLSVTEEGGL